MSYYQHQNIKGNEMKTIGKCEIETKSYSRETALQEHIAADGTKQVRELEKFPSYTVILEERDLVVHDDLGAGHCDKNGNYTFCSVWGTASECERFAAKNTGFPKWDVCDF